MSFIRVKVGCATHQDPLTSVVEDESRLLGSLNGEGRSPELSNGTPPCPSTGN